MPERRKTDRSDLMAVANAGALARDAAERSRSETAVMETPYGRAVVHVDGEGADVELPEGGTVHVRFR